LPAAILTRGQAGTNLGKVGLVRSLFKQFVAPNADMSGVVLEEFTKGSRGSKHQSV
jgi:hypothetical protein